MRKSMITAAAEGPLPEVRMYCYGVLYEFGERDLAARIGEPIFRYTRAAADSDDPFIQELGQIALDLAWAISSRSHGTTEDVRRCLSYLD